MAIRIGRLVLGIKPIVTTFEYASTLVTGQRGRGKDVLFGNVIARRNLPYCSNLNYGYEYNELTPDIMRLGSTFEDIVNGNVKYYQYPFPDNTDIYISDAGIMFPSQYSGILDSKYKDLPLFFALSRHLFDGNIHANVQVYSRLWNKLREQVDQFIYCERCVFVGNIVFLKCTEYDRAKSCEDHVPECRVKVPIFGRKERLNARIRRDEYATAHGKVRTLTYVFINRSKHDTRHFKEVFLNGKKPN